MKKRGKEVGMRRRERGKEGRRGRRRRGEGWEIIREGERRRIPLN